MPALNSTTSFEIFRKGQVEPTTVFIRDPKSGDLTDVLGSTNTFSLIDINSDLAVDSGTFGPTGSAKIVHPSTGVYQYVLDTTIYKGEYLLSFNCLLASETVVENVFVKSVSARHFAYASMLRLQVDKARKSIADDIENMDTPTAATPIRFFYGYSDAHLIFYLERGLQILNAIPPYTAMDIDVFPFNSSGTILIDAATIAALESQGIFAIDTDFDYALGGNSLVIDHYTKLNSVLSSLLTRFDKSAIAFKQQYRSKGLVMFQFMPGGVRSLRMLSSMPAGWWSRLLSSITGV